MTVAYNENIMDTMPLETLELEKWDTNSLYLVRDSANKTMNKRNMNYEDEFLLYLYTLKNLVLEELSTRLIEDRL